MQGTEGMEHHLFGYAQEIQGEMATDASWFRTVFSADLGIPSRRPRENFWPQGPKLEIAVATRQRRFCRLALGRLRQTLFLDPRRRPQGSTVRELLDDPAMRVVDIPFNPKSEILSKVVFG